jgi:small-conductance mechanosensitive channel
MNPIEAMHDRQNTAAPSRLAGGRTLGRVLAAALCLFFLAAPAASSKEQVPADSKKLAETALDPKASLSEALESAKTRRDRLKTEMEEVRREGRALAGELAAYRIQLSTYGNLAVLPAVDPEIMTKALVEQRRSEAAVRDALDRLAPRRQALAELLAQIAQQRSLNQTQLDELNKMATPPAGEAKWLEQLAAVIQVQKEILALIEKIDALHATRQDELQSMAKDLAQLSETLVAAREKARHTEVFTRGQNPLSKLDRAGLAAEAQRLRHFSQALSDPDFWRTQTGSLSIAKPGSILTGIVLSLGLLLVLVRIRAALRRLVQRTDGARWPWRSALLAMLQRTVVPLGLLIFLTLTIAAGLKPDASALPGALISFFWVWLPGDWVRRFFTLPIPVLASPKCRHLAGAARWLVRLSRIYAAAHIFLIWTLGSAGMLEALARLALEVALAIATVVFWRRWPAAPAQNGPTAPRAWIFQAVVIASYTVVLAAPALDLAGYGALALYWYGGWGLTLVAFLWSALMGESLREIERPKPQDVQADKAPETRPPLNWALLRLAWLVWGLAFLAALALAWGGWQSLGSGLGRVLNHPFEIGDMTFRLSGALIGVLLLFFTHLAVRLWRQMLPERVLARSGLTHGARESISAISGYLIWAVGILLALYAFGISTTSLTVVFGALGIGLGFGLQNIFNNFISGLILLFERPIQVGDDIEINGIWAKVLHINVRATVVKTYDNAALIIPNSEFISNQVTNWSHTDPYLRRNINVGVAYGSDLEKVRQTLLEAAANTAEVLTQPAPDVLFTDFGASSLDFRLRVWTTVEKMLRTDTHVRFEIDRLFRLRGIEIAFPQQDLHVRSLPNAASLGAASPPRPKPEDSGADDETP